MKKRRLILVLLAAVLVPVAGAVVLWPAGEPPLRDEPPGDGDPPRLTLRLDLSPGAYELVLDDSVRQRTIKEVDGLTTIDRTRTIGRFYRCRVEVSPADEAGDFTMNIRFLRLRAEGDRDQFGSFDTDRHDPLFLASYPLGEEMRRLLEARLAIRFGPDWQVREVSGLEGLLDEIGRNDPRLTEVAKRLEEQLGGEKFGAMISRLTNYLPPPRPVGVGAVWYPAIRMGVPIVGSMDYEAKCKLTAIRSDADGPTAVIAIKARAAVNDRPAPDSPRVMVNDLRMDISGQVLVRVDSGLVAANELSVRGQSRRTVTGDEGPFQLREEVGGSMRITLRPLTGEEDPE